MGEKIKTTQNGSNGSTLDEVITNLNSSKDGLSKKEAKNRLKDYGYNEITKVEKATQFMLLLDQFNDYLIVVLLVAATISALLHEYVDAIAILAIVIINAFFGFIQEYKAEQSIEALKSMMTPVTKVKRDGMEETIDAALLVPGDILVLETGDRIAADAILVKTVNMQAEEAALTGESASVSKHESAEINPLAPIHQQKNKVFMGTHIVSGRGLAIVTETGMKTELGKIADLVQSIEKTETPIQKKMSTLGRKIGDLVLVVCIAVTLLGTTEAYFRGDDVVDSFFEMFLIGVSLAVAAIPEGLPIVITLALAVGVQKMSKRNALIRRLPAVEALGSATVICSDKTGTITENKMTVTEIDQGENKIDLGKMRYDDDSTIEQITAKTINFDNGLHLLLASATLCNNAQIYKVNGTEGHSFSGSSTETAILVATHDHGLIKTELENKYPRIGELVFDSSRKRMSTIHTFENGEMILFSKGAPEVLAKRCSHIRYNGSKVKFTEKLKEKTCNDVEEAAQRGLRVMAFAYKKIKKWDKEDPADEVESDLVYLGTMAIIDPPKKEVRHAVSECRQAGIHVIMITGDHHATAEAVAREIGLIFGQRTLVLTGEQLDKINDEELSELIDTAAVFARISPEHKLRIVKSLQDKGHVVAMSGDGVNDAPAVKVADIGISMGITGTDVTKETSDMILADDNFSTIVNAVEEGRITYDSMQKFIRYMLSCNVAEVMIIFLAILVGWDVPLIAVQILWVNIVTDALPALAMAVDPPDEFIMYRPPRKPTSPILSPSMIRYIFRVGAIITIGTLFIYWSYNGFNLLIPETDKKAQTMAFTSLVFFQFWNAFNATTETERLLGRKFFRNKWLLGAVFISFILQVSVVIIEPLHEVFNTSSLTAMDWIIVFMLTSSVFWFEEFYKWLRLKKHGGMVVYDGW
ncbi:MAG: cation-translocating P-type ATPase [Candidatus Kariarchaeaceae archaeon]